MIDPKFCQHTRREYLYPQGQYDVYYCLDCATFVFEEMPRAESYEQFDPRNNQPAHNSRLSVFEKWIKGRG